MRPSSPRCHGCCAKQVSTSRRFSLRPSFCFTTMLRRPVARCLTSHWAIGTDSRSRARWRSKGDARPDHLHHRSGRRRDKRPGDEGRRRRLSHQAGARRRSDRGCTRALERDRATREEEARLASVGERLASLTPREQEVLSSVVAGRLNKQIAAELGIAEKTVKVHRARVMAKMAVRSVADLVRIVQRTLQLDRRAARSSEAGRSGSGTYVQFPNVITNPTFSPSY